MHYAEDDSFPQPPYSLLHPKVRLTQAERDQLAKGLTATLGGEGTSEQNGSNLLSGETGEQERTNRVMTRLTTLMLPFLILPFLMLPFLMLPFLILPL
jgi:hypothetical protein